MLVKIRDALIALVVPSFNVAYPAVKLVTDNAPFDWNAPPERFVEFEIKTYSGSQIGMQVDPRTRYRGFIYVTVYCRTGLGSKPALELLDWFTATLAYQIVSVTGMRLTLEEPDPGQSQNSKGWYTESLKVSFYADPT